MLHANRLHSSQDYKAELQTCGDREGLAPRPFLKSWPDQSHNRVLVLVRVRVVRHLGAAPKHSILEGKTGKRTPTL